ncbi:MAG: aminotransferase class III-fold pyridoxal phosphate-dependent enzyme, partial [Christensenellales bacterium]
FHIPFKPMPWEFDYVTPNDIPALYTAVCERTAAVVIEPILGEGGVIEITPEYYRAVRRVCDKNGALMIADEIQTGMGRTGELLASPALGALPDVVVLAKSLGSGVPTGAFLARGGAAKAFAQGDHGSTFGGNHLACAAALYVTDKLVNTDILARVKDTGAYFKQKLCDLKQSFCAIADVRGRGLMLGIEFHETAAAKDIQKKLLSEGFVTATAGKNTLRFLPPYTIEKAHIDALAVTLEAVLGRI